MADVGRISEVVDKNTRNITHFVLSLKKLGVFPGLGRPRVLWLGTEGDVQRLCDLQKTIDDGLDLCGFQKDERPFKPHLTLGRFKSPLKNISALQEVLERADAFEAGSFDVGSLSLFKSDLRPDGAVYTEISRFPLKGS
jgi:2'-5' RNA ligase